MFWRDERGLRGAGKRREGGNYSHSFSFVCNFVTYFVHSYLLICVHFLSSFITSFLPLLLLFTFLPHCLPVLLFYINFLASDCKIMITLSAFFPSIHPFFLPVSLSFLLSFHLLILSYFYPFVFYPHFLPVLLFHYYPCPCSFGYIRMNVFFPSFLHYFFLSSLPSLLPGFLSSCLLSFLCCPRQLLRLLRDSHPKERSIGFHSSPIHI